MTTTVTEKCENDTRSHLGYVIAEEELRNNADGICLDDIMKIRSRPVQQPAPEDVQFSERELIHIDSILTLHAIEHLPKGCNCPECISIHKKIAELRKSGKQGGKRE
jgi:hypothetical protein